MQREYVSVASEDLVIHGMSLRSSYFVLEIFALHSSIFLSSRFQFLSVFIRNFLRLKIGTIFICQKLFIKVKI